MASKQLALKDYVDLKTLVIEGEITSIQNDILDIQGDISNINGQIISLSGEVDTKASETFVTDTVSSHNISNTSHQDIRNSIPSITGLATETFVTSSISDHNINGFAHQDIRTFATSSISEHNIAIDSHVDIRDSVTNVSNSLSSYALSSSVTALQTQVKSFVVTNPSVSAEYTIFRAPYDLTITNLNGFQTGGTNLIGMLTECDSNGLNPVKINSTDMTLLTSNVTLSSFSNPSIDSGDYIGWVNTNLSGDVTKFIVTFEYVRS